MHTGENEHGLKKITDLTRLIAIVILVIHFYYYCYHAFMEWQLTSRLSDQLLHNNAKTGLLSGFLKSKSIAIGFALLSALGVKGRKDQKLTYRAALIQIVCGLTVYFASGVVLSTGASIRLSALLYGVITGIGFLLLLSGCGTLTRIIRNRLNTDVFNKLNESFPQEERRLDNEFSINLPAQYQLKGRTRKSWLNIINPMRGLLVIGSPGSGKSYFIIEHVIRQHISKGFSMFIYDYKYDDLTRIAYNHWQQNLQSYVVPASFYVINFDDLTHCHRCNPIDPANMHDITDAVEAARVILLGLNRSWLKPQGEFFVESPINFLIALIWFLRKYEDGAYCTLPHVIELMQTDMEKLFTILRLEPEIETYINPFISAIHTGSLEQIEGQLDAAKIGIARLSSPALYYVMSGNDFTLDINNPDAPKLVSLANNPQKQEVYGPVLSLYMTRMTKIINQKNKLKSSLVIDEFSTLTFLGLDTLVATGRSNKIATTIAIQDISQLRLNYSKELADVIINICGNMIVGQVGGDLAKQVSERLGKTLQERESVSINSNDTSVSHSKQLEIAVPVSTIASLSSGEFVGMVSDNPDQPIALKTFHAQIINDHSALEKQKSKYVDLPEVRVIDRVTVLKNYDAIRKDIRLLVEDLMEQITGDPALQHLEVKGK